MARRALRGGLALHRLDQETFGDLAERAARAESSLQRRGGEPVEARVNGSTVPVARGEIRIPAGQ